MPLNILIIGAGICGPALATLLRRADPNHQITVLERFDTLRKNGLQIDVRAQGLPVLRKMGLLDAVKAQVVPESGVQFVDAEGRVRAALGVNDSGKGAQALSSEYEIMRGDLVDVLYGASLEADNDNDARGNVRYELGKSVSGIEEREGEAAGVEVTFTDGTTGTFDLVVGADGQGSRTRRMLLGCEASEAAVRPFGLFTSYLTIPRTTAPDPFAKWYMAPGRRTVATRNGEGGSCRGRAQVSFQKMCGDEGARAHWREVLQRPVREQKEAFAAAFRDAGWESERYVEAMLETDDFYATEIVQIKSDTIARGRVALLGDAGYCPAPITGMGTTLALTGAYVLAGELARHGDDVPAALENYGKVLRPYITEAQKLIPGAPGIVFPETSWGVSLTLGVLSWITWLKIDQLFTRFAPEDKGGLAIPEYPELNLKEQEA
ncbi:monooxygenase [Xylariaceae sp. FL0016]|nr:monooxygenase [Xylariaceae sp. FL0016]